MNPIEMGVAELFENAAIKPQPTSAWRRSWHGSKVLHELLIEVFIAPLRKSSRYSGELRSAVTRVGYRLELSLASDLPVRFSVIHVGIRGGKLIEWVNRRRGLLRVPHPVAESHGFEVWCSDAEWAGRLLDITEVSSAIIRLGTCEQDDAKLGHPCVFISPLQANYYRRAASLSRFNALNAYLEDLVTVYRCAQDLPPPLISSTSTGFERLAVDNPLIVGGLIVFSLIILIPALLLGMIFLFI
ncbi:MAG: hypothetical protein HKN85_00150 [Gammaproteobacteria bacterium]|nr:hypothetical protein [Gammaproteobacteria bacterium]